MQVTCKRKLFSYFFFFFFLIVLKPRLSIHNGQLETRQISKFHREFRGAGTGKGVGHFVKRGGTKLRLVLSFLSECLVEGEGSSFLFTGKTVI